MIFGAVEKVNFLCDTPKTPKGDLLKSSDLESPPGGFGGANGLFQQPLDRQSLLFQPYQKTASRCKMNFN